MNILEKYYLQGKGKIILGTFALIVLFIISTVMFTGCFSSNQKNDNENTVTVFNYGDYIDVNVLKTFEKETGIQVKYEEYVTPEDMYTKYKSGVINYDVICTSDYMVEKMMQEGELIHLLWNIIKTLTRSILIFVKYLIQPMNMPFRICGEQ